ncbi:adenosylmethionine decarboxylase [Pseudalkalibacillus decolorationis]|uniref:adenosylmethionine decarboxylase n=1 Tax=Pseudalkalibacillus decolorationis TaxID=163879 RepID=UPI0021486383|nr:adenosylmethionine decarboxylase [Pseudalkalibacillus decolorationis]
MKQNGQHIVIDAYGCREEILNNMDKLEELLTAAINSLGMEIISSKFHLFQPQGVTGTIVISTSHFSIHTWPENGYVAMDLYTCGNYDLWPQVENILKQINAEKVTLYEIKRGEERANFPEMKQISLTDKTNRLPTEQSLHFRKDKGNEWDHIQLKQILKGKFDNLYQSKSAFQDILLMEANDIRLYLDQELQFSSLDEKCYHEALVHPALELAETKEKVLILGGGDGLALREVLKYSEVKTVDLVDIDPVIIKYASTIPELVTLNNGSFQDKRANVIIKDAKQFLLTNLKMYDVIIIDFPDPVNELLAELYTKEIFQKVSSFLTKDGIIVCQSNSPEDAPHVFWGIGKTIESAQLFSVPYQVIVPSFGLWGFHLASQSEIKKNDLKISAKHQTLPENLDSLFIFPSNILEKRYKAVMNTQNKVNLHQIYQEDLKRL